MTDKDGLLNEMLTFVVVPLTSLSHSLMVSSIYVSVMSTEIYVHDSTCGLRKSEISEVEPRDKA